MPLINDKTGTGDPAITAALPADIEAKRQLLRQKLIAARGSTYTYKDPDGTATRAGARIGNDGRIVIGGTVNRGISTGGSGPSRRPRGGGEGTGGGGFGGAAGGGGSVGRSFGGIPSTSTQSYRDSFVGPRLGVFESIRRRIKAFGKKGA